MRPSTRAQNMARLRLMIVALVLLIVLAACATATSTPTPVPPPTAVSTKAPTAVPPTKVPPAAPTAGQLAELGKAVYTRSCSACHDSGPGPAVPHWMQRFSDAQQIFQYASTNMPRSAPGSLKPEEYFQVVAWALVDQKIVLADAILDINKLAEVATKK